ncbi:Oxygen regulatory protein NreC [Streptomyces sp. YIM 130001]|uniref:response regulator transcription factor n=1 Tax=Streptomyces sp. YIM 130001 TaxID=2259644 RepID=UPI000E65CBB6|nr:response regulator transcription factor [Streptomyces sp. YIM 130001]RII14690.1 Oxygen regulatory protein NreC [Streptomyces sp. YIM 130001]
MRVVIAEDAAVLRELLVQMLTDRGYEVCAAVGEPDGLRAAVTRHRPDAAVVDIRMPPTHTDEGLRAAIAVRRELPDTGVLLFSQYVETKYATELLADGSSGVGYLLKERVANIAEFTSALDRVAAGGTALDPEVVTRLAAAGRRAAEVDTLTDREQDVMSLMAEGRSNTAIAGALHVSAGTVEKHVAAVFGKLGLPASQDHNRRVLAVLKFLRE